MSFQQQALNELNRYLTNVHPRRYDTLEDVPEGLKVVKIQDRYYPEDRVDKIGKDLTMPRYLRKTNPTLPFVETDNLRGYVGLMPSGAAEVDFKTLSKRKDDANYERWGAVSPEERNVGMDSQPYYTEAGIKDLRQFQQAFNTLVNSSQGAGLYLNNPLGGLTGTRASIYRRQGFVDTPYGQQYLDKRRFSNSPAIRDVLAYRDSDTIGQEASVLHPDFNNRVAAMKVQPQVQPQVQPVISVDQRHDPSRYEPEQLHPSRYEPEQLHWTQLR